MVQYGCSRWARIGVHDEPEYALSAITRGNGSALFANILKQSSTAPALFARNSGSGPAAQFDRGDVRILNGNLGIGTSAPDAKLSVVGKENVLNGTLSRIKVDNPDTALRPLDVTTNGKSQAAFLAIANPDNNLAALEIHSDSKGGALFAFANGPTGNAGFFRIFNQDSDSDAIGGQTDGSGSAISGVNTGSGRAGFFEVEDTQNASPAIEVTTQGTGPAGLFNGDVVVNGTLSKSAGQFQIDHPLDPDNKYLNHSFVESSEMMNIYSGIVTLDENGQAQISLPDWFEALNKDIRYQLTPVGAAAPQLHISQEYDQDHFKVAGGHPELKVSWQVTGVRQDAYANAHRIQVEEPKHR